jgi:hypothetical protein
MGMTEGLDIFLYNREFTDDGLVRSEACRSLRIKRYCNSNEVCAFVGHMYHEIESWLVSRHRQEIFVCSKASKEALGLTRPPVQCLQLALSPGVQLATYTTPD